MKNTRSANTSISYKTRLFTYLFLLVFIMILIISAIYYINLKNSLERNIIDANSSMITLVKKATENTIKDVHYSLIKVVSDPSVENFMLLYNNRDTYIVEVMDFLERLNSKITYSKHYSACYLYYEKEDKVVDITSGRILDRRNMTSIGQDEQYLENNREIIDNVIMKYDVDENSELDMQIFNINTKYKDNVITFVKPVVAYKGSSKILLFITIDHEYFDELLASIKSDDQSNVFIIDKDNKDVSINKNFQNYMENIDDQNLQIINNDFEGSFIGNIDNEENLVSFVTSEKYGWKFIYTTPTDVVFMSLRVIQLQIAIILIICILLGVSASFILAGKIYLPIKGLMNTIHEYSNESFDSQGNDIRYIESSIKKLISTNRSMEEILRDSVPILRNAVLVNLLLNKVAIDEDIWQKLDYYKANVFPNRFYSVFVVGIDNYDEYAARSSEKQIDMTEIYLIEKIREICADSEFISVQNIRMNQHELVLLTSLHFASKAEASAQLYELIAKVHASLSTNMNFTITTGMGSVYSSIYDAYKSFSEARSAYGYKIIKGSNRIITSDEIPKMQDWYYIYPFDIEKAIYIRLKEGDSVSVQASLNNYFEYIQKHDLEESEIKYAFVYLLNNTIKCCVEMGLNVYDVFSGKENLYEDLLNQNTVSDIHAWFESLFLEIMEYINIKRNSKSDEIVLKIIEYIDSNFISSEISMDLLSEQLHYSESYLSKLFKYTTNESIKKYITRKRMEMARTLLEESGLRVNEIGQKVGYPNTQSFIKIFKKYYGVTPGEYHDRRFKKLLV